MSQHIESTTTNLKRGQGVYNGAIGRCACGHLGQLEDGVCRGCRQAAERARPRSRVNRPQPLPLGTVRFCPDCGAVELTGHQQYCTRCAKFRRAEARRASKARRQK